MNTSSLSLLFLFSLSVLLLVEGKTVKSSKVKVPEVKEQNVFVRFAKGLALEAVNEAKRDPRFGFNITLPLFNDTTGIGNGTFDILSVLGSGAGAGAGAGSAAAAIAGVPVTIKFGKLGLKSAVIGGLLGLKTIAIQIILGLLAIAFLATGTAFFVCNLGLVSCGNLQGGGAGGLGGGAGGLFGGGSPGGSTSYGSPGGSGGSSFSNLFSSRTGLSPEQAQPIYKAIDEGYKKFQ